ncbi:MAG: flagellar biosynthetic protein FliO [Tepidisphaeraceae bacterium]
MRAWILGSFIVVTIALATARSAAQSTQPADAAPVASTAAPEALANPIKRGSPASSQKTSPPPSMMGGALRVAGSLAAVLGLIGLMYWGTRRLLPGSAMGRSSGAIHVLARTHLSPKQKILVIQVGRRVLVVGDGGGGQLNTLCEIGDPDEAAALIGQIQGEQAETGGRSFASLFTSANARLDSPDATPTDEIESAREQLDGLMHQVRGITRQIDRP